VRVLHGSDDRCQPVARGRRLAELTGGDLVLLEDAGHLPHSRDPVKVTRLITEFADQITGAPMHATTWTRGPCRPRRALYLSSPIGLGHARRDVAVAKELKRLQRIRARRLRGQRARPALLPGAAPDGRDPGG
jgi:hypothetical protein